MQDRVGLDVIEEVLQRFGISGPMLQLIVTSIKDAMASRCEPAIRPSVLPNISAVARQFHRDSLRRTEITGHHIEDPSWNILLAIFADAQDNQLTSVTSAVYASGVPPTTALRCLERLTSDNLITKQQDWKDRRRTYVRPTSCAMDRMDTMIRRFCIAPPEQSTR